MKKDIHPQYYTQAKVKCACGSEFLIGSTKENTELEICSKCHPFYTGEKQARARGGRVEKFKARLEKQGELTQKTSHKKSGHKEKSEK